jgi:hypothetical protein
MESAAEAIIPIFAIQVLRRWLQWEQPEPLISALNLPLIASFPPLGMVQANSGVVEGLFPRDTQRRVSPLLPLSRTVTLRKSGLNGARMRLQPV